MVNDPSVHPSIGEIVEAENFCRLRITTLDRHGVPVPVIFHTDCRGLELIPLCIEGHTLAVMYAETHYFLDGSQGLRIESLESVKIIPLSMGNLLQLSDQLRIFSRLNQDIAICHGCGKLLHPGGRRKCGACLLFYYCGKDCQTRAWTEKLHKHFCRVLRDRDVKAMLELRWERFQKWMRFSTGH
eukprot:Protomagalhaensia_sp_Gyna_25__5965@NODE_923_length_2416_cov_111_399663_g729_i0_p2_GENE_NODE_923_length_2416_cov_111_399663_g729_i0NODE_923_length_2416_cov_111_399663_g729_i0_p2_ORF_typecomplete_len185_score22_87zfMYND/PF01753_18/2_1e08Ribosomal_L40e/PF01020_17/0_24_NODE_923_length_2416_cov_111_399663_g729_i016312185